MSVNVKSDAEIDGIRKSCRLLKCLFEELDSYMKEGRSTKGIDIFCYDFITKHGGKPAFLNYQGFPGSACVSINEEVIHGIPSAKRIIEEGDLVTVDLGINLNGFFSDSAHTYEIGKVQERVHQLNVTTREALYKGIDAISDTMGSTRVSDISRAIYDYVRKKNYGVVRDFCGHGVGLAVHEDPMIPNYVSSNVRIKPGFVIAIEPMITLGKGDVRILPNKWTVVTKDK
ncbi:MAG TPA: type I methionyl aminopeptidase, partial [Spirochaetaceae bacterium]|nr:type I methionyl aminopeptidase [Spirochaetaceae bacterium]